MQVDQSMPKDKQVQGIVIYSTRAKSIAAWLQSMELCFIKVRAWHPRTYRKHAIGRPLRFHPHTAPLNHHH